MRLMRSLIVAAVAIFTLAAAAHAQDSGRMVRIVVPFPPGGTADVIARLVGQQIQQAGGPRVVVENRPGGGTVIATDIVARAPPDGATIMIMSNSFTINTVVRANLPYDAMAFEPLCMLADSPQVLAVNEASPYKTLKEFVDAARARPGELSYAAVGPATTQHIAGEMFKHAAQINLTYVPFTGGAPAVNAILGNHVSSVLTNHNEVMEHLHSGKLRPLAVAAPARIAPLPNVPTFIESGYPDFETSAIFGTVAPPKTPADVTAQLARQIKAAVETPDVAQKLIAQGLEPKGVCGAEFRTHITRQRDKYVRAVRDANIKAE